MSVVVELKYCERCGGLWLRRSKKEGVICGTCSQEMRTNSAGASWRKYLRRKEYVPKPVIQASLPEARA